MRSVLRVGKEVGQIRRRCCRTRDVLRCARVRLLVHENPKRGRDFDGGLPEKLVVPSRVVCACLAAAAPVCVVAPPGYQC
jgi:hypothetical protein